MKEIKNMTKAELVEQLVITNLQLKEIEEKKKESKFKQYVKEEIKICKEEIKEDREILLYMFGLGTAVAFLFILLTTLIYHIFS